MSKLTLLTTHQASAALAGTVILKALAQRPNFYSAAVYLSQSSANLMILTNFLFIIACIIMLGLQKLFYGPLRPIEVEQLYEKAWFAVTEFLLAMTIFRGELGAWFLVMFFALLAGKVWGWIGEGRVEILEQQPPRHPMWFHTRLAMSLCLGIFFDITMLEYVVNQVMRMAKPDMMVMFGFEFAVLSLLSLSTSAKYAIQLVEISITREQKRKRMEELRVTRMEAAKKDLEEAERPTIVVPEGDADQNGSAEPTTRLSVEDAREALRQAELPVDENEVEVEGWEGKGSWVFYLDLATDFFKLVLYLSFFVILLVFYGLPIHIMRDVFLTCRSFFKRISDFIKYRRATSDMNARYPDATVEDIGREDVCIICREEMRPYEPPPEGQQQPNPVAERSRPKKLPCGHVLHFACLRSWLERQQVCPTCRRPVVPTAQTANAGAPGAAGAAGAVPGQHPPGDRPVARVFQLGPLRIGVGAARGEHMFEELQQQMVNNRAGGQGQAGQRGLQQYQFGIRWDGRGRARNSAASTGTIRDQLDAAERQIQAEMQALAQTTREYGILRNMQLQLDALRAQQTNQPQPASTQQQGGQGTSNQPAHGTVPTTATGRPAQGGPPLPGLLFPSPTPVVTQSLQAVPGDQMLQAGSGNLPAGMTLPEGWSMMPLRSTNPGMNPVTQTTAQGPPQFPAMHQTFQGQFAGPMPVPEHIRAMFPNMPGQAGNAHMHQHPQPGQQPQPGFAPIATHQQAHQQAHQQELNNIPAIAQDVAARHEQFLASLRTTQARAQEPAPPLVVESDGVSSDQESTAVPTNAESTTLSSNGTSTESHEATPAAQPLPSWGSQPSSNENGMTSSTRAAAEGSSSVEPSERKAKPATVEDLVEDPDEHHE